MPDHFVSIKNRFPFRVGTTSYIIPDDLVPNVEFLAPWVDDIELVLFESDEISNLPDRDTIMRLKALKEEHGLSYTIHLPLDIELGSREAARRNASVEKCFRIFDLCADLEAFAYIAHFHGDRRGKNPAADPDAWRTALAASSEELAKAVDRPDRICVETLDYPFEMVADIVDHHKMSVCLDAGHIAFYDYSLSAYLDAYFDRCRVIHLHGNYSGADHKDIGTLSSEWLNRLMEQLSRDSNRKRVLTLEVFSRPELEKSLEILSRRIP